MKYRIKTRKFSSNIIEKYIRTDEKGKEIYEPCIIPCLKKEEGDILCKEIFNKL